MQGRWLPFLTSQKSFSMTQTTPRTKYGLNPSPPSYSIFYKKHFSFVFLAITCDDKELTSVDDDWGEGGFTLTDVTGVKPWLLQALPSFVPHLQAHMFPIVSVLLRLLN